MQKFKHGVSGRANNAANYAANYADNSSNDAYTEGKNSRAVTLSTSSEVVAA